MKKIVNLLLFIGFFMTIQAQDAVEIRFGFQASPSFSWMMTDDTGINGNGANLGMRLGMLGEYYFQENYALTSGIGFAFNQGGTLLYEEGGNYWPKSEISSLHPLPSSVDLKYSLQYVEIPIGLKMRTKEFNYSRYFVEPNLALGFQTQAKGNINGDGVNEEKINIKDDIKGLGLSWGVGAGLEYTIGDKTALVGGVYFQNLFTDVVDDNDDDDSKASIGSVTIRIGIMF